MSAASITWPGRSTGTPERRSRSGRGSAGTGLSLLYAHREGLHEGALDLATRLGERLLEVSEATTAGRQWQMMQKDVDWTAPNFSHGTAGIAYFLARLSAATSESRFLDAALEGARHLRSIATVEGKGHLIFHNTHSRERLFYFGWCHGPTGTARLYFQLATTTSEAEWSDWLESIGIGLLRYSRGWRVCALVFLWLAMVGFPLAGFLLVATDQPVRFTLFGQEVSEVPKTAGVAVAGVAVAAVGFALALWRYRVLTRPRVRQLFGLSAE